MYSLDWRSPACDGRLQAHHAMDLPFVFDNTDVPDTTKGAPGARELAAVVSATWAAFARTGSPENPALPRWPAYTPEERATMVFDRDCRVVADPDRDARLMWERDRDARLSSKDSPQPRRKPGPTVRNSGRGKWVPAFAGTAVL